MKKIFSGTLLTIFSLIFTTQISAQTVGGLAGLVKSNADNNTCIFAKVQLMKLNTSVKNSYTDVDGRFKFSGLDTGKYMLRVIYLKHDTLDLEVQVKYNTINELTINLDPKSSSVESVKLTGNGAAGSGIGTIAVRQKGMGMMEVMGAEAIKQTPVSGAGDVLKKLSGASIQDNKFAIIRGLSDRYNFALLNGAPLPSSEADRKAFSFDMFPASQIESMSITKTATPDMPSEFAGGVISLVTRDIPLKRNFNLGINIGIHNLTTGKNFETYNGGKYDFLGFDDGTRALPKDIPTTDVYQNISSKADYIPVSKQFNGDFGTKTIKALPNLGLSINYAVPFKLLKKDAGINFSTVYNKSNKYNAKLIQDFGKTEEIYSYTDNSYTSTAFIGSMLNFAWKVNNTNKFGIKSLLNINSSDETILRTGTDFQAQTDFQSSALYFQQNMLASVQAVGEHAFFKGQTLFDWNIGYSKINKQIPNFRRIRYSRPTDSAETNAPYTLVLPPSPGPLDGGMFYSQLNENIYSVNYNYLIKDLVDSKILGKINAKLGGFHQMRSREFNARVLGYVAYSNSRIDRDLLTLPADKVFDTSNISKTGFILKESTNKSDEYTGSSSLNAGYAMLDQTIAKKLRLVYGARIEQFNQQLKSFKAGSTDEISIDKSKLDILPSLNINYSLTESANVRLGASKTLSRPEFRELAPFSFFDFSKFIEVVGNDQLVRTSVQNYDARFEKYFKGNQLISASVFYKHFTNPIEQVLGADIGGGTLSTTYQNALSAENYGIELEFRKNLSFLLRDAKAQYKNWKNYVYVGANYAWIRSSVDVSNIVGAKPRPLQGQSPYVFNASITYDNPENIVSFGITGNRIGKRIVFVGTDIYPDFYEKPRTVIDGQVGFKMDKKDHMNLKVQFNDILGQAFIIYQNRGTDNTDYNEATSKVMRKYLPGSSVSVAFNYKF